MKTVTIREAKINLSRLIERACDGEEVVISCGGKPAVRLVPLIDSADCRQPGSLKGKLSVGPEFFHSLPASETGE